MYRLRFFHHTAAKHWEAGGAEPADTKTEAIDLCTQTDGGREGQGRPAEFARGLPSPRATDTGGAVSSGDDPPPRLVFASHVSRALRSKTSVGAPWSPKGGRHTRRRRRNEPIETAVRTLPRETKLSRALGSCVSQALHTSENRGTSNSHVFESCMELRRSTRPVGRASSLVPATYCSYTAVHLGYKLHEQRLTRSGTSGSASRRCRTPRLQDLSGTRRLCFSSPTPGARTSNAREAQVKRDTC